MRQALTHTAGMCHWMSQVVAHTDGLTPANALDIIGQYDVVVDATDNPTTRYLIKCAANQIAPLSCMLGVCGSAHNVASQLSPSHLLFLPFMKLQAHNRSGPASACVLVCLPQRNQLNT